MTKQALARKMGKWLENGARMFADTNKILIGAAPVPEALKTDNK
jgi:hypothetical protein